MWKISTDQVRNKDLFTRAVHKLRYDVAIRRVFDGKMQVRDLDHLYMWYRGHMDVKEQTQA